MRRRLSDAERAELEARRNRLRQELRLTEAELRLDARLRMRDAVQRAREAEVGERPGLGTGRWRDWVR